ncbi:MAG: MlaD family protein [Desulfobacterales bacterium]|nr:MlaD family protein [Desulfobacterales bacterium]
MRQVIPASQEEALQISFRGVGRIDDHGWNCRGSINNRPRLSDRLGKISTKRNRAAVAAPPGSEYMKKYTMETIVGIFVIFGLLCIGYMTVKLGKVNILGDNSYSLMAKFTTVTGLRIGSPVNILGIDVGRVEKITMDQENQKAVVELRIKKDIKDL